MTQPGSDAGEPGTGDARTVPPARWPRDAAAFDLLAALLARDSFGSHLGFELIGAARGSATVRMQIRREHINFRGVCHGGAVFSLADMALGLACHSFGTSAATIDAHMALSVAVREGEWLTAHAVEVSRTRRLAVCRVDLTNGGGTLVGCVTGTVYLPNQPLPDGLA